MDITKATRESLSAADHLTDMDKGAVETLIALAIKLDMQDAEFESLKLIALQAGSRPPAEDHSLFVTYLKYAESLGLTPAGRENLGKRKAPEGTDRRMATLTALRNDSRAGRSAG